MPRSALGDRLPAHAQFIDAAAVHLEHLVHVWVVQPRGMRVSAVMWLELASQVWPGCVGQICRLVLAVALADRCGLELSDTLLEIGAAVVDEEAD